MKKGMMLMFILCMSIFLSACDGLNATSKLELKSIFDNHQTTVQIGSNVQGFNFGDILDPYSGKSKFNTKTNRSLKDLESEIRKHSPHLTIDMVCDDVLAFSEITDDQKVYSYFIKFLGIRNDRNYFMIGEQRFAIDLLNHENNLIFIPYHFINDLTFDGYIETYRKIKVIESYELRDGYTIDNFKNYYQSIKWADVEQNQDTLIITGLNDRIEDSQKSYFFELFILSFEEEGVLKIEIDII